MLKWLSIPLSFPQLIYCDLSSGPTTRFILVRLNLAERGNRRAEYSLRMISNGVHNLLNHTHIFMDIDVFVLVDAGQKLSRNGFAVHFSRP